MYKSNYENPYRDTNTKNVDPSLTRDPNITTSIKKNDDIQTAEIEKGEIVAKPDLVALYKAVGKKHNAGGIPTYLEPDSFVFSNDNSMAFNKKEHDAMELKMGSKMNKSNNTPAEVLKRNIDIEHYNKLNNNLKDPLLDDIGKRSSALMLSKYQESLGKIAFLQEAKKGFEEGIPDFAKDSAPVYDTDVKTNIKEQTQYMKYGGSLLPKMFTGGNPYELDVECQCGRDQVTKKCLPCSADQLNDLIPQARIATPNSIKGMNLLGNTPQGAIYHTGTDPSMQKTTLFSRTPGPQMSNADWLKYTHTPERMAWVKAHQIANPGTNDLALVPTLTMPGKMNVKISQGELGYNNPAPVPDMQSQPAKPYNPYVGMSSDQTLNLGYSALQAAMVKRYDPMRPQIKSPLLEQEYYNSQGALNSAYGAGNTAYDASRVLNPYLANAANQETTGKLLDNSNNIISQYAERNVGVGNLQNQTNHQTQVADLQANIGFDKGYYDQTVAARQNFDDLKSAANNETMSLYNNYRGQNRQLQEFLSQQRIAGNVPIRDKKGNITGYQEMPLYGYDSWSGRSYKTPAGNILNARAMPQQSQYLNVYNNLLQKAMDGTITKEQAIALNSLDGFISSKNSGLSQQYKKGGRVRNPYN